MDSLAEPYFVIYGKGDIDSLLPVKMQVFSCKFLNTENTKDILRFLF